MMTSMTSFGTPQDTRDCCLLERMPIPDPAATGGHTTTTSRMNPDTGNDCDYQITTLAHPEEEPRQPARRLCYNLCQRSALRSGASPFGTLTAVFNKGGELSSVIWLLAEAIWD